VKKDAALTFVKIQNPDTSAAVFGNWRTDF
jgi:hypothetical protein